MNMLLQPMALAPVGSLDSYIYRVHQIPLLSLEEEVALAVRLREKEDVAAAKTLVMSHLRFVVKIARGYLGYGLGLSDLIQEGNIGLMKAVKRFDPAIGVRLVSFAVHWIKAEIHDFILKNWRIVKVATTKAQRKLFFNLNKAKKRLGWFTREEVADVANSLGVDPSVVEQMEARLSAHDIAFDNPNDEEDITAPAHVLANPEGDPALLLEHKNQTIQTTEAIHTALATLDERSRAIITARWFESKKSTLHELAAKLGVSAERVRQLENAAMKKLQHALQ